MNFLAELQKVGWLTLLNDLAFFALQRIVAKISTQALFAG